MVDIYNSFAASRDGSLKVGKRYHPKGSAVDFSKLPIIALASSSYV
jgi:hypothetical protein